MRTSKTAATLVATILSLMCGTSWARADDTSPNSTKSDAATRYLDFVSVGTPVTKFAFQANTVDISPLNFTPGVGVGYTWKEGAVGVFFYPTITLQNNMKDLSIAPHVTVSLLYLINLGLGGEWKWRENNAGISAFHSRTPILTVGIAVPIKILQRLKL